MKALFYSTSRPFFLPISPLWLENFSIYPRSVNWWSRIKGVKAEEINPCLWAVIQLTFRVASPDLIAKLKTKRERGKKSGGRIYDLTFNESEDKAWLKARKLLPILSTIHSHVRRWEKKSHKLSKKLLGFRVAENHYV